MKNKIYLIIAVLLCMGCKQDKDVITPLEDLVAQYRVDDAIVLESSSKSILLDVNNRREQALLITWEPLKDIEALFPVKYLFKMDITEKGFTTAIPTQEISAGINFKSFTHEELETLLRKQWNVVGSNEVSISIRVIAQVESESKFIKPLYSTVNVMIKPFNVDSKPLFLYGDAINSSSMAEIKEITPGELYAWRGLLKKGTFKIAQILDKQFPAYGKGEGDNVQLLDENSPVKDGFLIPNDGIYAVLFDRLSQRIDIQEVPYLNIYIGGSSTPTLWTSPASMVWDVNRPNICTATINLVAGELKFSTLTNFSATTMQLRPFKPDASILTDFDVLASVLKDWKWRTKAEESGRYKVELDVKSMKVQFTKIN